MVGQIIKLSSGIEKDIGDTRHQRGPETETRLEAKIVIEKKGSPTTEEA